MAKKVEPTPVKKKKQGHGWRIKPEPVAPKPELTEEELNAIKEEREVEKKKHSGPIRSTKRVLGARAHINVRLRQDTLDWLAAEAQIKSTTVSQLVRSWVETKEKESNMAIMSMLGRSGGDSY